MTGPDKHEATAADVARPGISDRQGQRRGDRRIDCVAAAAKNGQANVTRLGRDRHDHAMPGLHGRRRCR